MGFSASCDFLTLEHPSSDEFSDDEVPLVFERNHPRIGCRRPQRIVCLRLSTPQRKCRVGKRWAKRTENLQDICAEECEMYELLPYETSGSRFQHLMEEPQALKAWNEFTELPEDGQNKLLEKVNQHNIKRRRNASEGDSLPHTEPFFKDVPVDIVRRFEEELLAFFEKESNPFALLTLPSTLNSFERKVVHEVSHYYRLNSKSVNSEENGKQVIVANHQHTFFRPCMLLSDCLEIKRQQRVKKPTSLFRGIH